MTGCPLGRSLVFRPRSIFKGVMIVNGALRGITSKVMFGPSIKVSELGQEG